MPRQTPEEFLTRLLVLLQVEFGTDVQAALALIAARDADIAAEAARVEREIILGMTLSMHAPNTGERPDDYDRGYHEMKRRALVAIQARP